MASILSFPRRVAPARGPAALAGFLQGFSLEVMPRTAAKVADFRALLPAGTRVYVAHLDGTDIADMVATVERLAAEGFEAMPHVPARIVPDRATLDDWLGRYRAAGVRQALVIGGGVSAPRGDFHCTQQLLETGLFEAHGFTRLHVAGHPEGNTDIDTQGGERIVMEALAWKAAWAARTGIEMAIATQFCFEAEPVIAWERRLRAAGIALPVHIGVAGPAKLQTLIRFAMACGVGPSMRVLTRRAKDVTRLMLPMTPEGILTALAEHKAQEPASLIERVHVFPLGGIGPAAEFLDLHGRPSGAAAAARA